MTKNKEYLRDLLNEEEREFIEKVAAEDRLDSVLSELKDNIDKLYDLLDSNKKPSRESLLNDAKIAHSVRWLHENIERDSVLESAKRTGFPQECIRMLLDTQDDKTKYFNA